MVFGLTSRFHQISKLDPTQLLISPVDKFRQKQKDRFQLAKPTFEKVKNIFEQPVKLNQPVEFLLNRVFRGIQLSKIYQKSKLHKKSKFRQKIEI